MNRVARACGDFFRGGNRLVGQHRCCACRFVAHSLEVASLPCLCPLGVALRLCIGFLLLGGIGGLDLGGREGSAAVVAVQLSVGSFEVQRAHA